LLREEAMTEPPERTRTMVSLVDDDIGVLTATAGLLRSLGYSVETFGSAAEFLRWIADADTNLVITDLMMPDIDGLELQRMLVMAGYRFPVIFLTAVADSAATARMTDCGARNILTKPYSEQTLIECVESALGESRPRAQ
jgi:FixJ family two-component response regulator